MIRPATLLIAAVAVLTAPMSAFSGEPSPASVAVARLAEPKVPNEAWSRVVALGSQAIPHLDALLKNPNDLVKARASVALYRVGQASALEVLSMLLESRSPTARAEAATALYAFVGSPADFDAAAPPERRAEAVRRWKAWWKTNRQAAMGQKPMSRLCAKALAVDPRARLVAVTLAARHGATKGMSLTVVRGIEPVCELEIVAVAASASVTRIVQLSLRAQPRTGDRCFYLAP